MNPSSGVWPNGMPEVGLAELETRVLRGDGTVVLDGNAVCYTMPMR